MGAAREALNANARAMERGALPMWIVASVLLVALLSSGWAIAQNSDSGASYSPPEDPIATVADAKVAAESQLASLPDSSDGEVALNRTALQARLDALGKRLDELCGELPADHEYRASGGVCTKEGGG